jgi:hypothetical protein
LAAYPSGHRIDLRELVADMRADCGRIAFGLKAPDRANPGLILRRAPRVEWPNAAFGRLRLTLHSANSGVARRLVGRRRRATDALICRTELIERSRTVSHPA